MFKFAMTAAAASAAAEQKSFQREEYIAIVDLLPDADVLEGGWEPHEGRDHTEWSWHHEHKEAEEQLVKAGIEVEYTEQGVLDAVAQYEDVKRQIIPAVEEHQRNCQLHREEEMNLYYQCTQNDINNYALHHFGGNERSYPRWVAEYNVCIDHLQHAKWLWLDFHHDDGRVTLEPCDPQTKSDPVYIEHVQEEVDIVVETHAPLDPAIPCDKQEIPDWSGLWIEISGGETEAQGILDGSIVVDSTKYTERCYSVKQTGPGVGKLTESFDWEQPRTYQVTKRRDDRFVPNGCMVHTHLDNTAFTQWISAVEGTISMADQIIEEWHELAGTQEKFVSKYHEIKIGTCAIDSHGMTVDKHYSASVVHATK